MDKELKNRLWNVYEMFFYPQLKAWGWSIYTRENITIFFTSLWDKFFKWSLNSLRDGLAQNAVLVKNAYTKIKWYEVYDFIEFLADEGVEVMNFKKKRDKFVSYCSSVLEEEMAGYSFINGLIAPITDKIEVEEIQEALEKSSELGLEGVKTHLDTALSMLSDRKKPNFRKSIDESILAVESLCRKITEKPKAKLGEALNQIEREGKIEIHTALKQAYSKIYGFASDAAGIRHGWSDELTLDFADAKYMLVSCSAFINYLILKTAKAGIKF